MRSLNLGFLLVFAPLTLTAGRAEGPREPQPRAVPPQGAAPIDGSYGALLDMTLSSVQVARIEDFVWKWVYDTDVPVYKLTHSITEEGKGEYTITGGISQARVGPSFAMPVPLYAEFDNGNLQRLGLVTLKGATTLPFKAKIALALNLREDVLAEVKSK